MLSAVAKVWLLKVYLNIDWLLAVFRFLHATLRKTLPKKCGQVTSGGGSGGSNHLDENGNPLPAEEASCTADPVRNRKTVSWSPDERLSQSSVADGRTAKCGKDGSSRKKGAVGRGGQHQGKPKVQRLKKNEGGTRSGSSIERDLGESSGDLKNQKQDFGGKEAVEPCIDDSGDGLCGESLGRSSSMQEGFEDEPEEQESMKVNNEAVGINTLSSLSFPGEGVSSPVNKDQTGESASTGRGRSKKKRKKKKVPTATLR